MWEAGNGDPVFEVRQCHSSPAATSSDHGNCHDDGKGRDNDDGNGQGTHRGNRATLGSSWARFELSMSTLAR